MLHSFMVPEYEMKSIHELRTSPEGRNYLQETGRYKDYMRLYERGVKPFMAWDGEGWTDRDGNHSYFLLQNSKGHSIHAPRLSSWTILQFIIDQAERYKENIHIIYGGGYDVTHWLRDIDIEIRKKLKENNTVRFRTPNDVAFQNFYQVDYIPHKWFSLSGRSSRSRKIVRIQIFDVMTFFQSSFIKALESRNLPVPDEIKSGKASRNDFTYDDLEEISRYCQLELEGLVALANQLRDEFKDANLTVSQWHGPGAVASAVFRKYKIIDHKQETSSEIEYGLQRAYFGGRFEQFKAGHYDGKVYVYDIRSAYPDKIRNLPTLAGAHWKHTNGYRGLPGIYRCSFDASDHEDSRPNPLPWRGKTGRVGFPGINRSVWVWHYEAEFATQIHEGYELYTDWSVKPFRFIEEMYNTRAEWKAIGRGGERALKLAMNSGYGKTAQRIGGKDGKPPKWHQLEWAGMITSATRAQIYEAIMLAPDSIIAIETDSIASMVPLPLDIGTGLGQWELTVYDSMTYIQSGIYFADDTAHGTKVRSRGIDVKQLQYPEVMHWLRDPEKEPLLVQAREFVGLTANRDPRMYGQWTDTTREIRVAGGKRIHLPDTCPECRAGRTLADTMHPLTVAPGMGIAESYPHPLPWRDGDFDEDTPEHMRTATEAIAEYDSARHTA